MDSLEDDVLVEILKRLSNLKDIHRCKCVSKRWCDTISSDYFVRCYVGHNDTKILFGLFCQCPPFSAHVTLTENPLSLNFLLPPLSLDKPTLVLSANNGLVLHCDDVVLQREYHVCNPLTKQWAKLPPPLTTCRYGIRVGFLCKDFDTSSNSSSSFRIVRVPNCGTESPILEAEIYASETGHWTVSVWNNYTGNKGFFWQFLCHRSYYNATVCNGLFHWMGSDYVFVCDPYSNISRYTTLKLPKDKSNDMTRNCGLGECKGRLRFIKFYYRSTFAVWELKDYDNDGEWCLVIRSCLNQMTFQGPEFPRFLHTSNSSCLSFHPFEEDVVFLWLLERIILCNLRKKNFGTCLLLA